MNFLCRMGIHRLEFISRVEDSVYGHEFVTRYRCSRENCPQHFWWKLADAEWAHPDIPAMVNDEEGRR